MSSKSQAKHRHIRLGVLVPSSNTTLEPLTAAILSSIDSSSGITVTAHFSRFPVTEISLSNSSTNQFQLPTIISAARLLIDAKVDVIGWSGTSAGWLGFETDEKLCEAIENEFGVPATSSTLALNELLKLLSTTRLGLVTPYTKAMNAAIRANYANIGIEIPDEGCLGLEKTINTEFAEIDEHTVSSMVAKVVDKAKLGVITTFCTNLKAAHMVTSWESEHIEAGLIVLDSVSTVIWGMLRKAGIDTDTIKGWGKVFEVR